jgi:hypothetical protein
MYLNSFTLKTCGKRSLQSNTFIAIILYMGMYFTSLHIYYWIALDPSKHEELHHILGKHLAPHPGLWTSRRAMKENAYE